MPDDHQRHELVKGELTTMAPANSEHGATVVKVTIPLGHYVMTHGLGVVFGAETGFVIERNPDTVLAPDLAFVSQSRIDAIGVPRKFWPGAPDLVVEVVSPSDTVYEVDEKAQAWLTAGSQLVWVVNAKRQSITIYRPGKNPQILFADDILSGEDVIAGFQIPIRDIFL
jgi:Uma2 family endonuclease